MLVVQDLAWRRIPPGNGHNNLLQTFGFTRKGPSTRSTQCFWPAIKGAALSLPLLVFCGLSWAQASAPASAPAGGDGYTDVAPSLGLGPFITWAALVLGVIVGVLVFARRRRRGLVFPTSIASAAAVVVALVAYSATCALWLNGEQKDCRTIELGPVNTSAYAISCGTERESAANAFGTVGLYIKAVDGGAQRNQPVSVQVLNLIESGSLALATLALFGAVCVGIRRQF